jgi:uncharacterized membrane protein
MASSGNGDRIVSRPPGLARRPGTSVGGLDPNVAAAAAYVLGWVTGLIFFLLEPNNRFVRFHALQSIFLSIAVAVIGAFFQVFFSLFRAIPVLNILFAFLAGLVYFLLGLAFIIITIMMVVRAYRGEMYRLPGIGDMADQSA